jgi:hypothetical protein
MEVKLGLTKSFCHTAFSECTALQQHLKKQGGYDA